MLTRQHILHTLRQAFEPQAYAHAMWEAGAASWGRVDEWSDIDLQFDVEDDHVAEAVALLEGTINQLSGIELKYEVAQAGHGHFQAFYRLQDTSPFLLLDVVVMKHSHPDKFLEREIHGDAVVHFDKSGVVQSPPFDEAAWQAKLQAYRAALCTRFDLFQVFTLKEIHRNHPAEAMVYYQGGTLRPLIELLGMRYRPTRYNFHTRYVYDEFPPEVVSRLEALFFVRDMDDLHIKHAAAGEWFHQINGEMPA